MLHLRKIGVLSIAILCLFIIFTACSNPSRVSLISNGEEHEKFSNHHSFRDPSGATAGGGGGMFCEDALAALVSAPLGANPQIIIEGEQYRRPRYRLSRLVDDEWVTVIHGQSEEEWEQIYAESFFELLEPGEYKLYIGVSWGNARSGMMGQYFFKFTK